MSETGKPVCLIMGAGTGLGLSLARVFAQAGFRAVMARRDADACEQQAQSLLE